MMTLLHRTEPRSAEAILEAAREFIECDYRAAVYGLPDAMRHIGGYHIGWWDSEGRPTVGTGKTIRPALAMVSAAAMSREPGDSNRDRVIAAALTVELVHDFTQLHDDVMDGDRIRRHRRTAWLQFGLGPAILTGDIFLATAMQLLARHDVSAVDILMRTLSGLCEGQSADLALEQRESVDLVECIAMSEGKTATLMSAACELGAWAARADAGRMAHMREFGFHVGRMFQLVDDLLGVFGDPVVTGKPLYADLSRRKKSLPVVAALNARNPAGNELARRYAGAAPFAPDELVHLAQLVEEAGGRRWAEQAASASRARAEESLYAARPEKRAAEELLTLTDMIMCRDH